MVTYSSSRVTEKSLRLLSVKEKPDKVKKRSSFS